MFSPIDNRKTLSDKTIDQFKSRVTSCYTDKKTYYIGHYY